jgi:hypothetical protein
VGSQMVVEQYFSVHHIVRNNMDRDRWRHLKMEKVAMFEFGQIRMLIHARGKFYKTFVIYLQLTNGQKELMFVPGRHFQPGVCTIKLFTVVICRFP